MTAPYTAGTIDLVSGSEAVVGNDTAWQVSLIMGGTIYVEFDGGNPLPIAAVDSDTEITAALKWTGPTGTYSYAIVRDTAYGQQTVANAQALATYIQRLNNPALAATAGVSPGSNKLLLFTGANSATVIDLEDILQGVQFDEEVPTLADRTPYDGEAEGFRVLVADIGDGRSAFFSKKSAASGDWSVPFYISGPIGDQGPYTTITIGDTTTLPAGSDAEVTFVPVSPGVIRLDFALPKGADGSGTGDVNGPAGGVANNDLAAFADETGNLLKKAPNNVIGNALLAQVAPAIIKGRLTAGTGNVEDLTAAQANQVLGGWEPIAFLNVNAATTIVTGLSPFYFLRLKFRYVIISATAAVEMHLSTDNGATFLSGTSYYTYNLVHNTQIYSTGANGVSGNNGTISGINIGGEWTSGYTELSAFNAEGAYCTSESVQRFDNGGSGALYTRIITHRTLFLTARNAFRITSTNGEAVVGKFLIEGVRG